MDFEKFRHPDKVTGFSTTPTLQKKVKGNKYFNIQIPKNTEQSQKLEKGSLLEILIKNQDGQTTFFKKETAARTGGLKFYLPREVVEKLELDENDMLDVFISKD